MTNEKAIKFFEEQHKSPACFISLEEWRDFNDALDLAIEALKVQDQALNEWCTDCKEYDQERHCCPRFKRVIKSALEDTTDTNVGDLVSKQTVIDLIDSCGLFDSRYDVINLQTQIRNLPSAKPKTGQWLETEGLDEEIRCLMCTNPMRSDRGCDGACQYNEHVYKDIISALKRRMMEVEHEDNNKI